MFAEEVQLTIGPIGIAGKTGNAVLVLIIVLTWITACQYVF